MKDICIYAILYQYQMQNCKEKALEIFLLAEKQFGNQPILYIYGGDIYKMSKENFRLLGQILKNLQTF